MPIYHLHFISEGKLCEDLEGSELADLDAARHDAVFALREIVADTIRGGVALDLQCCIRVADAEGTTLADVTFCDAIPTVKSMQ
jgi:hypothetical protein